jgi:hypothetical protein
VKHLGIYEVSVELCERRPNIQNSCHHLVCDTPVAKKNFISLHGHGVIKTSRDMDGIGVGIHRGMFPSQPISPSTTRDYVISDNNSDSNLRYSKNMGPVLCAETNRVCCEEFMKSPSCLEKVTYEASAKRVEAYERFLSNFPADLVTRKETSGSIGKFREHSSLTINPTKTGVRYKHTSDLESDTVRKAKDETQSFHNEIGESSMDENLNLPVVTGDDLIAYFDWIHYDETIFD